MSCDSFSKPFGRTRPKLSVVVSVLNGARTIEGCILSVAGQTYDNRELVVIDGGSTDGTPSILKRYEHEIAYWESAKDRGICDAWNKGVQRGTGDWYYFLGADDQFYTASTLERVADRLAGLSEACRVAYGAVDVVDDDGRVLMRRGLPWSAIRRRFRTDMALPHQGVFHRRNLFELHGGFDESFRFAGDYELLLRELKHSEPHYLDGVCVARMRSGGLSSQPSRSTLILWEFLRARQKQGVKPLTALWSWLFAKALAKYALTRVLGDARTQQVCRAYSRGRTLGGMHVTSRNERRQAGPQDSPP